MSLSAVRVSSRLVVLALVTTVFALQGCKPTSARVKGTSGPAFDTTSYFPAKDQSEAFTNVGKRIMGVNPQDGDKLNKIGLTNVADAMGYKYAFNDCNKPWDVDVNGDTFDVAINSEHNGTLAGDGNGKCDSKDSDAPVKYTFTGWQVKGQAFEQLDPTTDDSAKAGAEAGVSAVTIDQDTHRLQVAMPEIVTQTNSNSSTSDVFLQANYAGAISTAHTISTTESKAHKAGIAIAVTAGFSVPAITKFETTVTGTYEFTYTRDTTTATTSTETKTVTCQVSVKQPAGCYFKLKLTANHVKNQAHYRGYLTISPQIVRLQGKLTDIGNCQNAHYRKDNGACSLEPVTQEFGTANSGDFISVIRKIADHPDDDKDWNWSAIKTEKDHQTGGDSDLNNALNNWETKAFSKVALDFYDVTESVTSCTSSVEVLPNSASNCTQPPPPPVTASGTGGGGTSGGSPGGTPAAPVSPMPQAQGSGGYPNCTANGGRGYGDQFTANGQTLAKDNPNFSDTSICVVTSG